MPFEVKRPVYKSERFRETTLGQTLRLTLVEMLNSGKITKKICEAMMMHFDVHMNAKVSRFPSAPTFVASLVLDSEENVRDHVWTFFLKDAEFEWRGRDAPFKDTKVAKLKMMASPSTDPKKICTVDLYCGSGWD